MSTQKGNANRSRPQKYQNHTAFKNNMHDTSQKTKVINSIEVANVCERCKKIIEWKIKYKKYKPLKAPKKCTKCDQKTVKHAYHIMCLPCAKQTKVCPKCNENTAVVEPKISSREESMKLDSELQALLKQFSERKRRTFIRYINRTESNKIISDNSKDCPEEGGSDAEEDTEDTNQSITKDNLIDKASLITKLKLLILKEKKDDDFSDSDTDDDLDFL